MSGDLISRSALWSEIMMLPHNGDMISSEEVEELLDEAPAVDAEPVVHAHWKLRDLCGDGCSLIAYCSNCGQDGSAGYERCPHCGAHMDEEVAHG